MTRKHFKAKNCPLCNHKPVVTPYPNNLGASVSCINKDCEMWGHTFDLDGWNHRKNKNRKNKNKLLYDYALDQQVIYDTNFTPYNVFRCKYCGKEHIQKYHIKHKKNCIVGELLKDAS